MTAFHAWPRAARCHPERREGGLLIFFLLLFPVHLLLAQAPDFSRVDAYARGIAWPGTDVEGLTDTLVAPFSTEREQVRAIFIWITENIAYDCARRARPEAAPDTAYSPLYDTFLQLNRIMNTRRTVCEGYAVLFKSMCNLAGIRCSIVEGCTRKEGETVDIANAQPTHAWNMVCIGESWYPVDVTWASGGCAGTVFHRELDEAYFLMTPEQLKKRHVLLPEQVIPPARIRY